MVILKSIKKSISSTQTLPFLFSVHHLIGRIKRPNQIAKALAISLILSGCSATGPGGLLSAFKDPMVQFHEELNQGKLDTATQFAFTEAEFDAESNELDDQLWGMQLASLYRAQQNYQQSNKFFDLIEDVMYQEDTESALETAGELLTSTFTNDTFLDYEQSVYDSIMVNTYKAINFTAMGDLENARVEWNRSDDRQRRAADYFAKKINQKKDQQQAELEEKAEKAKQKQEKQQQAKAQNFDTNKSISEAEKILQEQGLNMSEWSAYEGYVNPFSTFMHGLFFMLTAQDRGDLNKAVDSLQRVSEMTNTSVAAEALNLANGLLEGQQTSPTTDKVWVVFENGEMARKAEFKINLPLFLVSDDVTYAGIALPKLQEQPTPYESLMVEGINTEIIADMDKIIKAEFKEEFPLILAREITRTIVKTITQKQLNDNNAILGIASGIFQAVTTEADTRTWSMLPKNFQAAVLNNPKTGTVSVDLPGAPAPINVAIEPNKNNIIYVKAISHTLPPMVEVISL